MPDNKTEAEEKDLEKELEVPEDLEETPKQRSWDRKVILIASVFLALVLFGSILYLSRTKTASKPTAQTSATPSPTPSPLPTPTPQIDPKTGWYIYEDSGFTFEYPKDWKLQRQWAGDQRQVSLSSPGSKGYFEVYKGVGIELIVSPSTLDETLDQIYTKEVKRWEQAVTNKQFVRVAGLDALEFNNTWEGYTKTVVFLNNGKEYDFHLYSSDQTPSAADDSIFSQILSTFTFAPLSTSKFTQ